jgi:hypothetical protein
MDTTTLGRGEQVRAELEAALEERDIAQERYEAAVGTSAEWRAYERLRRATRRLASADRDARGRTPADEAVRA